MSLKQDLEQLQQQSDHSSDRYSNPPPQRRPRGFAAAAAAAAAVAVGFSTTPPAATAVVTGKGRKEREKEKERTKLRERHRRAITSRMLAGLRQHGNFPLPARADMNDVLAALARESGWTVDPDGTTYRQSLTPPPPLASAASLHPPSQLAPPVRSFESSLSATSLKNRTIKASLDSQTSFLRIDESLSPSSLDSVVVAERDSKNDNYTNSSPINSPECVDAEQLMQGALEHDGDFAGTSYIPVYVTLALTTVLAEIGLIILEEHAFSTNDCNSLVVFVAEGRPFEVISLLQVLTIFQVQLLTTILLRVIFEHQVIILTLNIKLKAKLIHPLNANLLKIVNLQIHKLLNRGG